ncbi:MAG: flagellar hook assembly protein FlgD [Spirochaetaceae bacterium]|nr:flagellar hook assembly protein FlgD [Spirochaetaceae bacterium]
MEIQNAMPTWEMSAKEKALLNLEVDRLNKETFGSRMPKQELGKNDFLELLIAQLTHQDPTSPVQDTEFIAQMAQFSSLEQMMNMTESLTFMNETLSSSAAVNAVGKTVELDTMGETILGFVTATKPGATPEVQVNGSWYSWKDVKTIYESN